MFHSCYIDATSFIDLSNNMLLLVVAGDHATCTRVSNIQQGDVAMFSSSHIFYYAREIQSKCTKVRLDCKNLQSV